MADAISELIHAVADYIEEWVKWDGGQDVDLTAAEKKVQHLLFVVDEESILRELEHGVLQAAEDWRDAGPESVFVHYPEWYAFDAAVSKLRKYREERDTKAGNVGT